MPMLILLECENSSDHVSTSIVLIIPKKNYLIRLQIKQLQLQCNKLY